MLCALIMAGGKGTRFWPLSTEERPKQFLNLIDEETMIQKTINRIKPIIPIERIFVCTGQKYIDLIKEQLPEIPNRNIIIEPEGRNTIPCIALSAFIINRYYKDSNMLVLPSDHLINNEDKFRNIVCNANEFINNNETSIITLGMKPTRPETGYGYIKYGKEAKKINYQEFIRVKEFVEKPNEEKAKEYISEGNYLWNGGMFLWSIKNILSNIKKYSPDTYEALHSLKTAEEELIQKIIDDNYKNTESISIDYCILEKSKDIYVIPSDFGWDDIGSWEAIERYKEKDNLGNILMSNRTYVNGENNLIVTSREVTVIDGLDNIYVIENDGKLFIGSKSNLKNIKDLKAIIEPV